MNKTIIWLGGPEDEQLLPVLRQNGYTIKFLQDIKQCQELTEPLVCLIYYAPGAAIKVEDIPTGVSVICLNTTSGLRNWWNWRGSLRRLSVVMNGVVNGGAVLMKKYFY